MTRTPATTEGATGRDALLTAADIHPLLGYERDDSVSSRVVVHAEDAADHTVPAAVLGNFFEHMSYATIGGMSAELLLNPTLSLRHHLQPWQVTELKANARSIENAHLSGDPAALDSHWVSSPLASGFGVTIFDDDTADGIPLGWSAIGDRSAVKPSVGRLGGAVRIHGRTGVNADEAGASGGSAIDGGAPGIRQAVFPPAHRTEGATGEAWLANVSGREGRVQFLLRRRYPSSDGRRQPGEILASHIATVQGDRWQQVRFELTWSDPEIARMEPVDFSVRWLGTGTRDDDLLIDRVSLLPRDHLMGLDPEVVQKVSEPRTPELRWPGGNFASFYHWRDGVGPVEDRPTYENRAWGGLEFNLIGTDEYLALCRLTGAEPHITVNSGTAHAEEAAAWVEYCNGGVETPMGALRAQHGHPEPYNVRIWEVGNENYGEWQGGGVGATENARRFARFAAAMRAASPIELRILACGSWFDFVTPQKPFEHVASDGRWHSELLDQAPNDIDSISLHSLPVNDMGFEGSSRREIHEAVLAQVVTGERRHIPSLLDRCDTSTRDPHRPPIEIAITEWGPLGTNPEQLMVENFGAVVWAGTFLNFVARNADRVTMASPNGLLHGGAIKKGAGVVYTDPQFDVLGAYGDLPGGTPLRCELRGPGYDVARGADLGDAEPDVPYIDVMAWRTAEGGLTVSAVNRDLHNARPLEVVLDDGSASGCLTVTVLSHDDVTARVDPARPERFPIRQREATRVDGAVRLELPPSSISWLRCG